MESHDERARKILFDAVQSNEQRYAVRRHVSDARFASEIGFRTRVCPKCGGVFKRSVVEHPGRELGIEGHTILYCARCGLSKRFDYCIDDARRVGEGQAPDPGSKRPRGTYVTISRGQVVHVDEVG